MRLMVALLVTACMLSACGPDNEDLLFDGQFFRSKLNTERGARADFTLTVKPVSASLLGAREAGRYEATVYCVNRYGRSDINWAVGPDSADEELTILNDVLTLRGTCVE